MVLGSWLWVRGCEGSWLRARDCGLTARFKCRANWTFVADLNFLISQGNRAMAAISSIDDCRALAHSKGGVCLSDVYSGYRNKLRWRCAEGHEWDALVGNMKKSWCPKCGYSRGGAARLGNNLAEAGRIAEGHGGRCLATETAPANTPIPWRCSEGHEWLASLSNVRRKTWCPQCYKAGGRKLRSDNLGEAQKLADERGGRCLETENFRAKAKVRWECSKGHQWSTQMCVVKRGSWCPTCSNEQMGVDRILDNLARARDLAARKGWKCLETENFQANASIHWECENSHKWRTSLSNILAGAGCSQCTNKSEGFCSEVLHAIFPGHSFVKRRGIPWLPLSDKGRCLELDLYSEELSLALEYNGPQHYVAFDYLGGQELLDRIQEHDRRKVDACVSEGVCLITISEFDVCPAGSVHPSQDLIARRIWDEVQALGFKEDLGDFDSMLTRLKSQAQKD